MVLIAEPNKITPAATRAAPASKLTPELESFMENHRKRPKVIAAAEINISSACALTVRARGGVNGIRAVRPVSVLSYRLSLYGGIDSFTIGLVRYFLTPVSRGIDTVFKHCPSPGVPNRGLRRFRFMVSSLSLTETRKSANRPTNLALLRHA
jgi:hypothetical protein